MRLAWCVVLEHVMTAPGQPACSQLAISGTQCLLECPYGCSTRCFLVSWCHLCITVLRHGFQRTHARGFEHHTALNTCTPAAHYSIGSSQPAHSHHPALGSVAGISIYYLDSLATFRGIRSHTAAWVHWGSHWPAPHPKLFTSCAMARRKPTCTGQTTGQARTQASGTLILPSWACSRQLLLQIRQLHWHRHLSCLCPVRSLGRLDSHYPDFVRLTHNLVDHCREGHVVSMKSISSFYKVVDMTGHYIRQSWHLAARWWRGAPGVSATGLLRESTMRPT